MYEIQPKGPVFDWRRSEHLETVRATDLRLGEAIDDLLGLVGGHDDVRRQDRAVGVGHHRRLVERQIEDRRVHVVEEALDRERGLLAQRDLGAGAGLVRAQEAVLERHQVEAGQREDEPRGLVVDAGARLQPDGARVAGGPRCRADSARTGGSAASGGDRRRAWWPSRPHRRRRARRAGPARRASAARSPPGSDDPT